MGILLKTNAKGDITNYEYDSTYPWMPSKIYFADPENTGDSDRTAETTYEYGDAYGFGPTKETVKYSDGSYSTSSYEYEAKYGNVSKYTDATGNVTKYEYDYLGRPSYVYYPPYLSDDGSKYPYLYYSYSKYATYGNTYAFRQRQQLRISSKSSYGSATTTTTDENYYDDYGNLVYAKTDKGEEKYIYDDAMRLVGYQNQADYGTDSNTMTFGYDGFDRVTSYTDRLGNTQNAAYKSLSTEYSFTPAGSTAKENHYTENYDIYSNKISEKIYPSGTGGSVLTTAYEYDLVGNVLKITDANGRVTTMSYDEVNNPTEVILADGNKVSYDYTKWNSVKNTTQYDGEQPYSIAETFDDRGLSTSHRQIGLEIKTKPWYYNYRADGLISLSVAPDGTQRSYDYDGSGNNTQYTVGAISDAMTYNHFGQLDKITRTVSGTQTGVTDYTYDSAKGWLTSKTTGLGTTAYAYNTAGKLTSVTSPSGLVRTYTRDEADRITTVTADEKNFTYEYYGDGLIKSITYPGGSIVTTYTYDNANRLTKLETKNGDTVLKTYSYQYDGVGNITSVSGSESATYTYDALNRLKTATENGYTATYEYDSRNNLISETRDDGYTKTYEYSGDNRLIKTTENGTETAYEYDLNGNLIKRGEDEFAYDSNDNLVYALVDGVETTYEIGEDGLRKSKTSNGVTTTYSIDENGNVITEGNDEIIIGNVPLAKKIDGAYYYYIYNAHGDVTMIVDESGNVQNTYQYDAWGSIINQSETIDNSHKYACEYYDDETGLIYLRARYYDPLDRRFIQEDPARDELNWYAYCGNNPVNFIDPTGSEKEGDEKYSQETRDQISLYSQLWFDAATAYDLGIIIENEKNAVQALAERKADELRYKEDHPIKTLFQGALDFAVFDLLLGDVYGGTVYAADLSVPAMKTMYGDIDTLSRIVEASPVVVAASFQANSKGRSLINTKIDGKMTRVDLEFPQGDKPGNLHVQIKGIDGKTMIESLDDLDNLPKKVRKNKKIIDAVEKGLKLLGKLF